MHDDVKTELQRPLDERGGKGVVADGQQPVSLGNVRYRLEVDELQQRIRGRLDPYQARKGADSRFEVLRVRQVDKRHLQPRGSLADILEDPVAAAIQVVHGYHVRPGVEQLQDRGGRCHSGSKGIRRRATLEVGHRRLQRITRRIARTRIVVTLVHSGTGLNVGGGCVDGRHDRACLRIRMLPAVDDAGAEVVTA